ncbi:SIS domain-containing protein [Saccharopolyspora elongata]|uniref:SIS domain-containing protein n=1 Tax=Saccharopolyspora elongata TaxID=2530387 RepID=A0A4R4Y648_9PSEU|nr:SIS domain-containing protein [Saccharopolyspora elongata]TDD39891.1 SIS domain-containing protein [Saccharopolyspora elongata]
MTTEAGTWMAAEIAEQPQVLAELAGRAGEFRAVAEQLARSRPRFVLFAARGSSDNAALYGKYLVEVLLGLPAGLVSPSTTTLYGAEPDLKDVALVAVSQSGGSPDLVEVTEQAGKRGAFTVAVTNTPDSPLGAAAQHTLDIGAGVERAVAATKTYSATLLALHLLLAGGGPDVDRIGELAQSCLDENADRIGAVAQRLRFADQVVTTARGYSLATAHEAALKLAETSYLVTRAYSGADLLHGPIAAVGQETAVLAVTGTGPGGAAMAEPLARLAGQGAEVLRVGPRGDAQLRIPDLPEELSPVVEALPLQRLAWALATARGYDPDSPAGLRKVTETR